MPEKDDDQTKKVELDLGAGKLSLGGLFQGIGNFVESVSDLVSKMEEEGKGEETRGGEFSSPSGRVKAVYGFSVKTNLGGQPTVESFGNVKKTAQGPVVESEREPLVDVFDEKDDVVFIIELPGIEEKQIHTEIEGDILTLSTTNGSPKYYKEIVLPKDVDVSTMKSKYKNGVLEIRMSKT
jgi:HSP20 family protein